MKRTHKRIKKHVEPLIMSRDSPAKLKGSDSVYTSKEAPPIKSTKSPTALKSKTPTVKKHRKIFSKFTL